jgi:hypothetical protein
MFLVLATTTTVIALSPIQRLFTPDDRLVHLPAPPTTETTHAQYPAWLRSTGSSYQPDARTCAALAKERVACHGHGTTLRDFLPRARWQATSGRSAERSFGRGHSGQVN